MSIFFKKPNANVSVLKLLDCTDKLTDVELVIVNEFLNHFKDKTNEANIVFYNQLKFLHRLPSKKYNYHLFGTLNASQFKNPFHARRMEYFILLPVDWNVDFNNEKGSERWTWPLEGLAQANLFSFSHKTPLDYLYPFPLQRRKRSLNKITDKNTCLPVYPADYIFDKHLIDEKAQIFSEVKELFNGERVDFAPLVFLSPKDMKILKEYGIDIFSIQCFVDNYIRTKDNELNLITTNENTFTEHFANLDVMQEKRHKIIEDIENAIKEAENK